MNKKYSIWGICFAILLFVLLITPGLHRQIRLQESKIVPKLAVTAQIKAVPDGDIKALLADRTSTTIIFLTPQTVELNQKMAHFIKQHQELGLTKPIYIFQELYHDAFVDSLKLNQSAINVVQFNGEEMVGNYELTAESGFSQTLIDQLKQMAAT
ncbi:MAG: hypothetical protein LBS41_01560 [Streptococcaceae bacterium]|jgi:hypothetical protein|nr:hypothetical protein [Streptococcaceae bacterium]